LNRLKNIYWRLRYRFQISKWSRDKRESFHINLYKGYYFCTKCYSRSIIPFDGEKTACRICGEEVTWGAISDETVIRITLQRATDLLKRHYKKKYGKKVKIDWMPHELNEYLEVQEKWT